MEFTYTEISNFGDKEYALAYSKLSQSRKEYINTLKNPILKKQTLAGEILIKKLLYSEYNITDAIIERTTSGRPYVKNYNIYISISHSKNAVVCAADISPIGVDIEKIRPVNIKIATRICTENEIDYLLKAAPNTPLNYCCNNEIITEFFKIWTAKEAYFKMTDGKIKNFKEINTLAINKKYSFYNGYIICITTI